MKAIVYHRYGSPDVLQLAELEKPVPGDDDVLVKIRAASVNPIDWHLMRGRPYILRALSGLRRPKTIGLGVDLAGTVEAAGRNVTQFRPGDEVFGVGRGALAEYTCTPASKLAPKPANLTAAQAAAVPVAAFTALKGLRDKGRLQPAQKVLINGAAGGVGTLAVQLAKAFGAEVTGVCSTRNVDLIRSLGADHAVDYSREDFTRGAARYDLIFDAVGNRPVSACRRVMTHRGIYVAVAGPDGAWIGPLAQVLKATMLSWFVSQKLVGLMASGGGVDLLVLKELIEAKKVTPVIDRTYPLEQAAEAIRYLETGHARGKVVIAVDPSRPN